MVSWVHTSLHPKRHLDLFSRFCTADGCAQHTDTDHAVAVAVGRIYPVHCVHTMWPNNCRDLFFQTRTSFCLASVLVLLQFGPDISHWMSLMEMQPFSVGPRDAFLSATQQRHDIEGKTINKVISYSTFITAI